MRRAWVVLAKPLMCAAVFGACVPSPPRAPAPRPATPIAAPVNRTWDAVIELFAKYSIPIETVDRSSGLIVTRTMSVSPSKVNAWVNCGPDAEGRYLIYTAAYNVLVRGDSASSTVQVTATWSGKYPCVTTGVYESETELAIKGQAEDQKVRGTEGSSEP